jgi:anti-sigma B factor antagonist
MIAAAQTMQMPQPDSDPTRIDAVGVKPPAVFAIEESVAGVDISLLLLRGELDLASAAALRARTDAARGRGLVIDLADVTFVDSSSLRELLHARAELESRGARLVLVGVPPNARRLLEMTGTLELFDLAETHEEALARFE